MQENDLPVVADFSFKVDYVFHCSQKFSISASKTPVGDVKALDHRSADRLRRFITCERPGCLVPIFSYFLILFLFSPIF